MSTHRAAVLDEHGVAVNVVMVDTGAQYDPGPGLSLRTLGDDEPVGPGHSWDGAAWHPPPSPTLSPDSPGDTLADLQRVVDYLLARDLEEA